jgi:copper chaperone CopZ
LKTTATIIGLALFAGTAVAKEASAEMKVPAMDCAACTVVIKKALTQTKGVKTVDLNIEKRTATVVYDDTQVTEVSEAPSEGAILAPHPFAPLSPSSQNGPRRQGFATPRPTTARP